MKRMTTILLLFAAVSVSAAQPADEVRQAEIAFAKAFTDRDQTKFFAFLVDDATFLGPKATLAGKDAVVKRWSTFFADKTAPFDWHPDRVVTNAAGTLGLSTGPVIDSTGAQIGVYSSVWQKNAKGEWKVIFDGPGAPPPCPPPTK